MAHPTFNIPVINQCNAEIQNVRITHFPGKHNTGSQVWTAAAMPPSGPGVVNPTPSFTGVDGDDDNWCVSFQLGNGVYMSGKVSRNMTGKRYDYELIIRKDAFVFSYKEGSSPDSGSSTVKTVFDFLG